MLRLLFFMAAFLILAGCNETEEIKPNLFHLDEFDVLGGPFFEAAKELSFSAFLVNVPNRNKWELVFYVNESEISRKSLDNSGTKRVEFARFTPGAPGQYLGKACIVSGLEKICLDRTFTVK